MNKLDLIRRGFFPKELPPPFQTTSFAENLDEITARWNDIYEKMTTKEENESRKKWKNRKSKFIDKYSSSKCAEFSISKGKISRRPLKIPNPKHYAHLVNLISDNWENFINAYLKSKFSKSYPVPEDNDKKRAVATYSKSVQDFRNTLLRTSINKRFLVRVDISKFYPSIYTHSIAWGFMGKNSAKKYFLMSNQELNKKCEEKEEEALLYKFANYLDIAVRACQDKQSIGIPIGPDSSHILSELIACRIDQELNDRFSKINLQACRFYDDFYLFVNTKDETEKVLKGLQRILNQFELEVNEAKIKIKEFPFAFEDEWVTDIFRFDFKKTNLENSLKHYFSLIWRIAEENSKRTDWIFKYALRLFEFRSVNITKKSWKIFEALLLKSALIEPAVLDIVTRIFLSYKEYLDYESRREIKNLIESVIYEHSQVNHHFEVSWSLWLAKTFEILITEEIANVVIDLDDTASQLILLSLANEQNLVLGNPNFSKLQEKLVSDVLFSEDWLLAYEAIKKGWLTPPDEKLIEKNDYFKILDELNVQFFDNKRQLEIFDTNEEIEDVQEVYQSESKQVSTIEKTLEKQEILDFIYASNIQ